MPRDDDIGLWPGREPRPDENGFGSDSHKEYYGMFFASHLSIEKANSGNGFKRFPLV
jgi:hypothetical protein